MGAGKVIKWDYDFISEEGTDTNPVCLTDQERQILLAMLDYVGWTKRWYSDIGTPIVLDQIEEWRDNLAYKLMGVCMVDCEDVWGCLGITGTLPDDLEQWLIGQIRNNGDVIESIGSPNPDTPSPVTTDAMFSGCDLDSVFGFTLQLVQFMNTAVTDACEIIEVITNQFELAQLVLKEVPFLAEVSEFVTYMQEEMAEAYLAAYTTDYENEVACDLFCLAIDPDNPTCTLTWEDCYEYFLERFGAGLANKHLIDLLTFVGGGGWSGTEFCDAALAAFCGVMHYGGEWFGLTIAGIQKFWNSWFNDPNSDWQTLCDCGYDYDYDFDQAEYNGWNPVYGQWATPEQLYSTGSSPYRLQVDRTFGTPFDGLQEVRVKVSWSSTGSPQCQLTVTHSGGEDVLSHSYVSSGWITFTLPDTRNGVSYIKFYTATAVGVSCSHDRFALAGIGDVKPPEPV